MQAQTTPTACGTLAPTFVNVVEQVRHWAEEVSDNLTGFDDVYGSNVEEVCNTAYDGFIPFTDGGFNVIAYATMSYAWGSGNVPTAIQPYLDAALKDAATEWDEKHPDATVEMIYADPEMVALEKEGQLVLPGLIVERDDWQRRQHPLLEKWQEFETNWMQEGGTYFYKARVLFYDVDNSSNVTGKPEAYFFVGINTDFEYGRDNIPWLKYYGSNPQQSQWLWEKNVPLDELTDELVGIMIKEATEALRAA